jgi:DNA-binding SARP family transcriptional activator
MEAELRLTLLGEPQVIHEGASVSGFAYQKSLALLAYLALDGRRHSREELTGLLWSEATQANARAGLRKVLADLRQHAIPNLIITRSEAQFDRERPYWLDVQAFERQIGEALAANCPCPEGRTARRLAAVAALYRGDFLQGFHVHRALAFEEWVLMQREHLRLTVLRVLHALSLCHEARGAYRQSIACVARVLALQPEQEHAHRQMMSLLARCGQRGAALYQYRVCRRTLARELGVAPDRETTALYERIRSGADLPAPRPTVTSLPSGLTCCTRERQLGCLDRDTECGTATAPG